MGDHIVDGQFKSDKYAWSPPGFVPLKLTDPMAHRPLWDYAQARRAVDAEFADDLETMLKAAGFVPPVPERGGEGWRQISTAPKDGTPIYGLTTNDDVRLCKWITDDDPDAEGVGCTHVWASGTATVKLRRWQPAMLPVPKAEGTASSNSGPTDG